ncbi:MAG: sigma-70 family RNA polymerase sigma factor, partial [Alistipes sp.]|nr:sigma-70 family RNA polymerase sigma factor [Alistipes sp.]
MMPARNNPAEVFEKYRRQLGAFIVRRIPSREEAEDILQEVFMRFVQTDALNPVTQVAAWLFRAARNRIIDHRRKHRETLLPEPDDEKGIVSEITALL